MRVFFATNRDIIEDNGKRSFGIEFYRPMHQFRVGHADVAMEAGPRITDLVIEDEQPPAEGFPAVWPKLGSTQLFRNVASAACAEGGGDILVFIHGAANSFADAIIAAAETALRYSTTLNALIPVAFTYPANGRYDPINYFHDRDDAAVSGPAMARAYGRLVDFVMQMRRNLRCGRKVHLLAHSLGNFALRKAVQEIATQHQFKPIRLFDTIILANADEDDDAIMDSGKLLPLTLLSNEIVSYFDPTDKLVRLSDVLHHDRLGQKGPKQLEVAVNGARLSAVDCRNAIFDLGEDPERHRHYRHSSAVINDIQAVFRGEAPEEIAHRSATGRPGFYKIA